MIKLTFIVTAILIISFSVFGHSHVEGEKEGQSNALKGSTDRLQWNLPLQPLFERIEALEKDKSELEENLLELSKQREELSENIESLNQANSGQQVSINGLRAKVNTIQRKNETISREYDAVEKRSSAFTFEVSDNIERINKSLSENQVSIGDIQTAIALIHDGLENVREKKVAPLERKVAEFNREFADRIDGLEEELTEKESNIKEIISKNEEQASLKLSELNDSRRQGFLYVVFGFLTLGILSSAILVIARKKISSNQSLQNEKINLTRRELESKAIRLDEKLTEAMENQLKLMKDSQEKPTQENSEEGKDHSLILKMADEVVRIEKNLREMDENTRGLKQLSKAVERIKANFASNAYEIVDMIGEKYDDKMKLVVVNFLPDRNLASDEEVITRIIKPQVNYKGEMIQFAKVDVSQGD